VRQGIRALGIWDDPALDDALDRVRAAGWQAGAEHCRGRRLDLFWPEATMSPNKPCRYGM
jgi:hypothetical protein